MLSSVPSIGCPKEVFSNINSFSNSPAKSSGKSKYIFISSIITDFSFSISSSENNELHNISAKTSIAIS